jgi:hypothetical protein
VVSRKLARTLARASFIVRKSITVADIDGAVGGPLPAAVMNMEVMAMPVVTMPVVTMPVVAVAMPMVPVMAVTSTMPAVAAMTTVTAMTAVTAPSESLTGDGQRSSCQRQSSDSGRNDLLDPSHERLLGCAARGSLCDQPT